MSRWMAPLLGLLLVWAGCDEGLPPPKETAPAAPGDNDPAFEVDQVRGWYLIGDEVTEGQDELVVRVIAPEGVDFVDMWIGDGPGLRLADYGTDFRQAVDIGDLPAGEHDVLLAADGADVAFARLTFKRSHPLYVIVTNDWDDSDNTDEAIRLQERLHEDHPEMVMTHFVGPYTFTDPDIEPERVDYLIEWLLDMRDSWGDEIGLHIHPYCHFVEHAELECLHEPSTVYADGDSSGYTVMCSAYSEEEFTTLLLAADALFEAHGLGKPTSFRAGGWTADLSTMHALANAGYVADTSANNWARMEEWEGVQNGVLYEWNMSHWASIDDTSQPYYPSENDILSDASPTIPVLQIPDNGILVDYVTSDEMIEILHANWPEGEVLHGPVAYSIGYHPTNFNQLYHRRMDDVFRYLGNHLAKHGRGPVVYGLMSDMPKVWPRP